MNGRRVTGYPSIRTDLANAGAEVVDDSAVVDPPLVTSRSPADLEDFCKALMEALQRGPARAAA